MKRLVLIEVQHGLKIVTDGEFRRSWWHLDFIVGLKGITKIQLEQGHKFNAMICRPEHYKVTGKIEFNPDHPFFDHYKYLVSITPSGIIPKISVPSPSMTFNIRNPNVTPEFYKTKDEFFKDISDAYHKTILRFYELGCRYFQIDDTFWDSPIAIGNKPGAKTDQELAMIGILNKDIVTVLNLVLADLPIDLTTAMHICRGNHQSDYLVSGAYDPVAEFIGQVHVKKLLLEFDDPVRDGGFEPLAKIAAAKAGQRIVLGLITSKTPALEKEDDVVARIEQAAKFYPKELLSLSAQCGFASTEEGNHLTEAEQWAKIDLIVRVAKKVWG